MLRWIWGGIRALGRGLRDIFAAVWNVLSSAITWVVASVAYLIDTFQTWINSAIRDGLGPILQEFASNAEEYPDLVPLASYYLDLFSIDEAATCLVELFAVWVIARAARLALVPIRAVLEIL